MLQPCCRFLTNKGIDYLREYLNLPSEIVPATLKKSNRSLERGPAVRGDRPPRREVIGVAVRVHALFCTVSVFSASRLCPLQF